MKKTIKQTKPAQRGLTDRSRAEQALRFSELRYRRLFETAQDGILILNAKTGAITDVNPFLIAMLGYSREEFIEKKLWQVGAFKDIGASKDAFEALQRNEYIRYENLPLKAKDGRLIQVEFVSNVYLVGDEKVIQCNIRDITEHNRAAETLRKSEERYLLLFEHSPSGVLLIDLETGKVIEANETASRQLGYTREEFAALRISDWEVLEQPEETAARIQKIIREGTDDFETQHRTKSGEIRKVRVWVKTLRVGDRVVFYSIFQDITDRKQAEEKVRESEERQRAFAELTSDYVYIIRIEPDGKPVMEWLGDSFVHISGYSVAEMEARGGPFAIAHPDDLPIYQANFERLMKGETVISEVRAVKKTGEVFWVRNYSRPVWDAQQNRLIRIIGAGQDITERKRAAEILQESEERVRTIANNIKDGYYYEVDTAGNFIFVSSGLVHTLGYPANELMGMNYRRYTTPKGKEAVFQTFNRVFRTGIPEQVLDWDFVRSDGTLRSVEVSAFLIKAADGSIKGFRGIVCDVTERKRAAEALSESRAQLASIIDTAMDAIITIDADQRIVGFNPAAEKMFGYPAANSIGQSLALLIPERSRAIHQEQVDDFGDSGRTTRTMGNLPVLTGVRANGEEFPIETSISRVEVAGKRLYTAIARDITARMRAEEALRESERTLAEAQKIAQIGDWQYNIVADKPTWSREMYNLFGRDPSLGEPSWQEHRPSIHPGDWETLDKAVSSAEPYTIEFRILHPTRGERSALTIAQTEKDETGKVVKLKGTVQDITERKRAEEALYDSREELSRLLNSITEGTYGVDMNGNCTFVNRSFLQILGYQNEHEILGKHIHELIHHSHPNGSPYPSRECRMYRAYQTNQPSHVTDEVFWRKDGVAIPVEYWAHPIVKNGVVIGSIATFVDITERKRAEDALRLSEERFSNAFHIGPSGLTITRVADGKIVEVNQSFLKMFEFSREEVIGHTTVELNMLTLQQCSEIIKRQLETGGIRDFELQLRTKSGRILDLLSSSQLMEIGGEPHLVNHLIDITERKRATEALRASEERLLLALQIAPVTLFGQDRDLKYTWIHNLQVAMQSEDVVGKSDTDFVPPENAARLTELKRRALSGEKVRDEVNIIVQDNTFSYEMIVEPVRATSGQIVGVTGVTWDITERKRAAEALAQAHEQLRALNTSWQNAAEAQRAQIAREIHDEFGQSLSALKMDLTWLANRLPAEDEKVKRIRAMTTVVDESIAMMRRIATELRPGLLDDLGLNAALEWQAREFARRTTIPCNLKLPNDDLALEPALNTTLFRIFQESLTNVLRHAQATRVDASFQQVGEMLILTVQDDGRGIVEAELQAPQSLGLLGMRERATQWGGTATIRGTLGKGTTVTVQIPRPALPANGDNR